MARKINRRNQSGFSLVELMIVVGIIGVLATLALPRFQQFQAKAKMAEARNMLSHIYTLEQAYHLDNNTYLAATTVYGRKAGDGALDCTPSTQFKTLGFEINPCNTGDPVPRFGYAVTAADASTFTAEAATGSGKKNMVCPGEKSAAIKFEVDESNRITDETDANIGGAIGACTR